MCRRGYKAKGVRQKSRCFLHDKQASMTYELTLTYEVLPSYSTAIHHFEKYGDEKRSSKVCVEECTEFC